MTWVGVARKIIEKVAKGRVPKEGKIEDGTLDGPAARRERGIKEAQEIEKREKIDRTG
jgi:hypothetical protein